MLNKELLSNGTRQWKVGYFWPQRIAYCPANGSYMRVPVYIYTGDEFEDIVYPYICHQTYYPPSERGSMQYGWARYEDPTGDGSLAGFYFMLTNDHTTNMTFPSPLPEWIEKVDGTGYKFAYRIVDFNAACSSERGLIFGWTGPVAP